MKLVRTMTVFDKVTEELVEAVYLEAFRLEEIGPLFARGEDQMMFLCYEITSDLQSTIEEKLGVSLDLAKFDYFLECGTSADESLPGEPLGPLDQKSGFPPPLDPPAWIDRGVSAKPKSSG